MDYFEKTELENVTCKICKKVITTNMLTHVNQEHREVFTKIKYNDPEIKNAQEKIMGQMLGRCWIKKYCTTVDFNRYQCNICKRVLKCASGHYGNMKRHVRCKHPEIFLDFVEVTEENDSESEDEFVNKDLEYVEYIEEDIDNEDAPRKSPQYENDEGGDVQTDESNDDISMGTNEQFIKKMCKKVVAGKRSNKTCLWNFVEMVKENHVYKCMFCSKNISIFPHSVSNVKRHIKFLHPKQYELILKHAPEGDNVTRSSQTNVLKDLIDTGKIGLMDYFEQTELESVTCKLCKKIISTSMLTHLTQYHHEISTKIQYSDPGIKTAQEKIMGQMIGRCWIKKYCTKVDFNKYQCNICKQVLKFASGQYSNMKRHVRRKHAESFMNFVEVTEENDSESEDEVVNKDFENVEYIEEDIDNEDAQSKSPQYENDGGDDVQTDESDNGIAMGKNEQYIKEMCERVVEGKRSNKTCLWNFVEMVKENHVYKCMFCSKNISIFPHSVSNVKRHIKFLHPKQYELILKHAPAEDNVTRSCQINVLKDLIDTGIKTAQEKIVGQMIGRCWIKKYCTKVDFNKYQCNICKQVLKFASGQYSNMKRHVRRKHAEIFMNFVEVTEENDSESEDEVVHKDFENVEYIEEDFNHDDAQSKSTQYENDGGDDVQTDETDNGIAMGKNEQYIKEMCERVVEGKRFLDESENVKGKEVRYKCKICKDNITCSDKKDLQNHIKQQHPEQRLSSLQDTDRDYSIVIVQNKDLMDSVVIESDN